MYRSNLPCLLQHPQHPNPPQPLCPGGEPDAITECQRPESTSGGGGDHAKGLRQWKKGAETPRATCSSSGLCKPVQPTDTDTCANVRCEAAFMQQCLERWKVPSFSDAYPQGLRLGENGGLCDTVELSLQDVRYGPRQPRCVVDLTNDY